MVKIKEIYLWAVFIVILIAIASYFRFYYQPTLSISIQMQSNNYTIYPYQKVTIPIKINNTGQSTINNISIGLYINGNTTRIYRAYLPSGKQATVDFNYTPTSPGEYLIEAEADPGHLYNIINRQDSYAKTTVRVLQQEIPAPQINFPNGTDGLDTFNMNSRGYVASLYFDNFTKYLYLTGSQEVNSFLYPVIDVYSQYISKIYVSHAYYKNYTLAAVWIQGYISNSSISEAAIGEGINQSQSRGITTIDFGNSTTLCAWYSGGWTKILVSIFGENCTSYINKNFTHLLPSGKQTSTLLKNKNASILNYTGISQNLTYSGDLSLESNSIVFESIMHGENFSNICYGNILNISNISYCDNQLLQGNVILDQLERLQGSYNASVWWIPESNASQSGFNYSLKLIGSYNFTGQHISFVSAYADSCVFNSNITCSNPFFQTKPPNLIINLTLADSYNSTIILTGIACSLIGNTTFSKINVTLAPGSTTSVPSPCYNYGKIINSSIIPINIPLHMYLNYTLDGKGQKTEGFAEVTK